MNKKIRFNPRSLTFQSDPYGIYESLRNEEPVSRIGNNWIITRHEDVRFFLSSKNTRAISIPEAYGKYFHDRDAPLSRHVETMLHRFILFQEGNSHHLHKKALMPLVTGSHMKELEGIIHTVAVDIIESIEGTKRSEIMADLAKKLWSKVFSLWLNISEEKLQLLIEAQHFIRPLIESPGILSYDEFNQAMDALHNVSLLCDDILSLEETHHSLFYRSLLKGYGERDEVNKNFFSDIVIILIASSETNESLSGSLFLELARDETLQQELRDHPEKIKLAINETMRLHPPVQITRREATEAFTIRDKYISPGDTLLLCLGAANRDEEVFKYAHCFDLNRTNTTQHVGFSAGVHNCLGQQLALRQLDIMCQVFLSRLPHFRLDSQEEWQTGNLILRSLKILYVSFSYHN